VAYTAYPVDATASRAPSPIVHSEPEIRNTHNRAASLKVVVTGVPPSVSLVVKSGEVAQFTNPSYSNAPDIAPWPRDSAGNVETGSGTLSILVGEDGFPKSISIEKSSGYSQLDNLEIWAAQHWAFVPALKNNVNVDGYVSVPFNFNVPVGFSDHYKSLSAEAATPSQMASANYLPAAAESETPSPNSMQGAAVGHAVLHVVGWLGKASLYFLEGMAEGAAQQPTFTRRTLQPSPTPPTITTNCTAGSNLGNVDVRCVSQ